MSIYVILPSFLTLFQDSFTQVFKCGAGNLCTHNIFINTLMFVYVYCFLLSTIDSWIMLREREKRKDSPIYWIAIKFDSA